MVNNNSAHVGEPVTPPIPQPQKKEGGLECCGQPVRLVDCGAQLRRDCAGGCGRSHGFIPKPA